MNRTDKSPHRTNLSGILLLSLTALVLAGSSLSAQTWEPSARLWGWGMNSHCVIDHGNGSPLVHLYANNEPGVYDLKTINPESEPIDSLPGIRYFTMSGDVNGNGLMDIVGRLREGVGFGLELDVFTDNGRLVHWTRPGLEIQNAWNGRGTLEDLDGDGYNDPFTDQETHALISYGDPTDPLSQQSVVPYVTEDTTNASVVCLGTLEGKACMLRMVVWWHQRAHDSVLMYAYTLDVLNEEDLRTRRDTIRFETVQRYDVGTDGWRYVDCFMIWRDVWQIVRLNKSLRVQLSGIDEINPHETFVRSDGGPIAKSVMYGQRASRTDQFIRVSGQQPFVTWYSAVRNDTQAICVPDLLQIIDPQTLETKSLGVFELAESRPEHALRVSASLTPDLDGDGIGDVLMCYESTLPTGSGDARVVDLFLTGRRPTVSVGDSQWYQDDSQECAQATRDSEGWTFSCTGHPESRTTQADCFDGEQHALIYDSQGRQVAQLPIVNTTPIRITDPGALPRGPLWAIIGSCTVRLQ